MLALRSETKMMQLILATAQRLPQVKAVAMSGSRVNKHIPKDKFQDYDIVYIVDDKKTLLENRQWLDSFGPRLIMQTPEEMVLWPNELGECFTFLMLFEDDNRIDLTLCPLSYIQQWLASEPMVKILSDPHHLLADLPESSDNAYQFPAATQRTFNECCNEFWWVSTYVVKGLARDELLYASDHLYTICQKELLRLLSWKVVLQKGKINIGKNYKYLFSFLPEKQQTFENLLDFSSIDACWQSLLTTQAFFHEEAKGFAQSTGFSYTKTTAERVIKYTQRHYELVDSQD
nr:aminoglycoside 6-adenylyltransferase [Tetragenococcus solitarius]